MGDQQMINTILQLADIQKEYDSGKPILQNVNFSVSEGTIVAITGENGTGKSTLLRIIAGLDSSYKGDVMFRNEKHIKASTEIILLNQSYEQLFPWLTVVQNVTQPIQLSQGKSHQVAREKACEALANVGIDETLFQRYPFQLSGGQKQKVALARALALEPDILLMDEPFSAIDEKSRASFQTMLKKLAEVENKTIILVSHSTEEVNKLTNNVVCLTKTS